MSDGKKFERFGKYLLLDHLVDGGMAKIFRARYLAEQVDKIVAIKVVQPQFSSDPQFKTMFMDEIKVMFSLIHPNITQTYDYGVNANQLYTAMEYIDGKNLKQFLDRLTERKFVFPVEISVYITSQVCIGLSYAHNFTDKLSGKKLNIVHRDISPHNIMLTYDGAVKVIDFGIAKAETNSEATQAGTIKGKLAYLAPEYLDGLSLDHRYDQFAVGITLWELLCGRKLFTAPNDLAVLKKIQACRVPPPSSINPNVSKELDQIVLKSLSKDRNLRFENMEQMNRALVKFLYANYPDFNASDLSYFAKELFKEEIKVDREKLLEFGKVDVSPYMKDLNDEGNRGSSSAGASSSNSSEPTLQRRQVAELDLGFEKNKKDIAATSANIVVGKGNDQTSSRVRIATAKQTSVTKTGTATNRALQKTPSGRTVVGKAGTTERTRVGQTQMKKLSDVKAESSGGGKAVGGGVSFFVLVASLAVFAYFQADFIKEYTGFDVRSVIGGASREVASVPEAGTEKTAPHAAVQNAAPAKADEGKLILSGMDLLLAEMHIDGKKIEYTGAAIVLPAGKHKVKVSKEDYMPFTAEFEVQKDSSVTVTVPELAMARYGALTTAKSFSPGFTLIVDVDGEKISKVLPVSGLRLPVGKYEAVIKHPTMGAEKAITINIEENKNLVLE